MLFRSPLPLSGTKTRFNRVCAGVGREGVCGRDVDQSAGLRPQSGSLVYCVPLARGENESYQMKIIRLHWHTSMTHVG